MKKLTQTISLLISYTLIFLPLHAASIQTDGSTNTTLDKARNDVPVVNIANPNASGLSHNKFREYNVQTQGLILNNSRDTTVNTQLGGFIFGNKNLTSNAKVILNEVTSTSRSRLNGYTEVAGKRADLVIANPNGISINGAGFINTSSVTLSTGTPIINRGNLESFNILGGDISIEGSGLDSMGSDSTYIYTHFLKLNADIHAKNLEIKLGKNSIDANTKQITSSTNSNEVTLFLLDSSTLGGMYANRISLVGTDKGLGVNLPPEVLASTGEIYITNDGDIKLQNVKAKTDMNIDAKDADITIEDTIKSGVDITLKAKNISNNALINSSNDLTITSDNLTNNRTMFSGNDMFLYTKDTLLNNEDANIFAVNNLKIAKDDSNNKTHLVKNYKANIFTLEGDINIHSESLENITDEPTIKTEYSKNTNVETWIDSLDSENIQAEILSGHNLNLDVNNLLNDYSLIYASNDINFNTNTLNNSSVDLFEKTVTTTTKSKRVKDGYSWGVKCGWGGCWPVKKDKYKTVYYDVKNTSINTIDTIFSTIQAGEKITGVADTLNNGFKEDAVIPSSTIVSEDGESITYTNSKDNTQIISIPKDNHGLFVKTTDPASKVLIETNPEFALYENFISSDYMMSHINYDSQATSKKIGDALYENTLIRKSIFAQTGRRFLNSDIKNDNEQFKYLMDNAIQANKSLELSPGISLSKAQINALTQDIVWMEEQIVQGEKVLVPVVYIANANNFKLQGSQIIAGDSLNLKVATLKNSGRLEAGKSLNIEASDSITNIDGNIKANEDITLKATNDISNISANIKAKNINLASADGSIINKRYTKNLIGASSSIQASNSLNIEAKDKVLVQGSKLEAKDINIEAKNVDIVTTVNKKDFFLKGSNYSIKEKSTTHLASNINADNINIVAKETSSIKGSNLNATNDLNVKAKKIDVLAVNNSTYEETKSSSKGFFSSESTTTKKATSRNQASNLSGANVTLTATGDGINIIGSNLDAKETLALDSAKDKVNGEAREGALGYINIKAGYNIDYKDSKTIKTSMLSGSDIFSTSMDNIGALDKTAQSSNLKASNITLKSNTANIEGSNLEAQKSIDIDASEINIQTAKEEHKTWEQHEKISLTFNQAVEGIGNLGLSMATLGQAGSSEDDDDIINIKASYSKTQDQTNSINNVASNLKAKENLSLKANSGDINIKGSNLASGGSTSLEASNNINILSAYNKDNHSYKETSGYLELKITSDEGLETEIDLTLKDEQEDFSNAIGSTISSNANLILKSKNDTNIIGSDLSSGGSTTMQTDGELKIAAAKNTSTKSVDNLNIHIYSGGIPELELGDGQLEVELGRATLDKIKKTTIDTTATKSNISSDKDIDLTSEKSILVEGSDLEAKKDVVLTASEDITIKETKETSEIESDEIHGVAVAKFVIKTEYVALHKAILAVQEAKKTIDNAKDNYDDYKDEVKKQEGLFAKVKQDYKNNVGYIELVDVEEFEELLDDLKEDDKYYKANIALAIVTFTTKQLALVVQITKTATAASQTYGTALSASIELDIDAVQTQLEEYAQKSIASGVMGESITLRAKNKATVQGSTLQAKNNINIDATSTDILASKDNYDKSKDTQHQHLNISIGSSGFSMSGSVDNSETTNEQATQTNSNLQANNININTKEKTSIKGAEVKAKDSLVINTKNLEVASVQDTAKTRSHSIGVSAGYGGGSLSSLGANQSKANSRSKQTILTSLTGNKVDITTAKNTKLKGATIAALDAQGNDNGNLNLKTETLTASSLNNTYNSKSMSIGIQSGVTTSNSKNINKGIEGGTTEIDGVSTIALDYSNNRTNSKTKTLATLGSGNIQIANKEDSDTKMLNRDASNNEVDIYNISSHKGLKGELDTRLLTKDGRNSIKEDLEKTKRTGQSLADVATKDEFKLKDTVQHLDEVLKDLEIQKQFALQNDGKGIETLQGENSTIEQKQEAIKQYAKIYADTYGINIEEANIIATNKLIKGTHYSNDGKKSTIDINDNAQRNAKDYAKTMGHEVTHARISQGTTRDRKDDKLNEAYANTMGSYSADGMEFSSSTYNSINLNSKLNTNKHVQTAKDKVVLNTNNTNFKNRVKENGDKVDFEAYWSLSDVDRMNILSNPKTPIEEKINALVAVGLTPKEIKKSLGNNSDFKALLKNGDKKFDTVYAEQKNKVDKVNNIVDNTVNALQASELALGGREVVKNVIESITKKSLAFSIKNASWTASVDLTRQVITQVVENPQLLEEYKNNPEETMKKIYNNIDLVQTAVSAGVGSTGTKTSTNMNNLKGKIKARETVKKQLDDVKSNSKSKSKIKKLTKRLDEKTDKVIDRTIIYGTPIIIKQVLNSQPKDIIEEVINTNLSKKDDDGTN
ncbi:hemagglutinin repeat-containing protein [Sulfurimonas sp.]|uniref:two-partner secretion domain-containing protein n=1 Tax=Sulfurimonas sp. TaxID=2022749 RepID=UPI002AB2FD26|nr:hemagglutinin repeat-containing protein [Sulfurimonas sp.]